MSVSVYEIWHSFCVFRMLKGPLGLSHSALACVCIIAHATPFVISRHVLLSSCLSAVRIVIFAVVWLVTWGSVHFTILPNLYEDVGFWDSFKPIYTVEYKSKIGEEEEDDEDEENSKDEKEPENAITDGNELIAKIANDDTSENEEKCSDHEASAEQEKNGESDHRHLASGDA